MASITIRNLDEHVKTGLRVRAAVHGRSMEEEVRRILRAVVEADAAPEDAELRFGVAIMPAGARRDAVRAAIDALRREDFAGRILPFDSEAAAAYATLAASRRVAGRPVAQADAQIAAIAAANSMIVVTRNTGDFTDTGVDVVNLWPES